MLTGKITFDFSKLSFWRRVVTATALLCGKTIRFDYRGRD